jgi:cyclic pyranopterin phosphate synthase
MDSLDPERFTDITGSPLLSEILEGISCARDAGISSIKVNAVILGDQTLEELSRFQDWTRNHPITVRFIELMPTAANQPTFTKGHLKSAILKQRLMEQGWIARERNLDDGPAVEYTHPEHQGRIGLIAPYSSDFCKSCNRLRVTSRGALQLCLFAESSYSLRSLLQHSDQKEELKEKIASLLHRKEVSHYLPEGRYGNNKTFSAIGG